MPAAALVMPGLTKVRVWDTQHLTDAATRWNNAARVWDDAFTTIAREIGVPWKGEAAEAAMRQAALDRVKVVGDADALRKAARTASDGAGQLEQAKQAVLSAVARAQEDGFEVAEDLSVIDNNYSPTAADRAAREALAQSHANQIGTKALKLAALDQKIAAAITGAAASVGQISFAESPAQLLDNETGERDVRHPDGRDRNPDGQDGRGVREDEWFRRPPGGTGEGTDSLESDWAGRAILARYLFGGGKDWHINDDPDWTRYMMNHPDLARQLDGQVRTQAQQSLNEYLSGNGANRDYSAQFHAETQNGESIIGYQYLNGTNARAGDFQIDGTTHVEALADGNYKVTVDGGYRWNDIIDPNYQYETDKNKNRIAEILTLGRAEPYQIHIGWHSPTEFIFDQNGTLISAKGYPYR